MKKTRMSIVTLSLALAATLAFAGMAAARPHYMGGPGGLTVEQMPAVWSEDAAPHADAVGQTV